MYKYKASNRFRKEYDNLQSSDLMLVQDKIKAILSDPINAMTHPMRGERAGIFNKHVTSGGYRIYYSICGHCRKGKFQKNLGCNECLSNEDNTVKFLCLIPKQEAKKTIEEINYAMNFD